MFLDLDLPYLVAGKVDMRIEQKSVTVQRRSRRNGARRGADEEIKLRVQEAHHRFKNELQVIAGLLAIQARRVNEPAAVEALHQARNRIMALAHLNQRLQWDEDREVDVASLLLEIGHDMDTAFGDTEGLTCNVHCEHAHMTAKTAATIALIVCELVINAAKHAYQHKRGEVRIDLAPAADGWHLTVADDGPGFTLPAESKERLGWNILKRLVTSLHGQVSVKNGHGATVSIVFPEACA
jgi:two-component sensor histidine kinase